MAAILEYRLTGGSTNSDPNNSLGGVMSDTSIDSSTAMNNLFDNVTPDEASNGDVEYRAIDLYNSGDASGELVELWIDSETSSTDTHLEIAYDTTSKDGSDPDNECHTTSWSGEAVADEGTEPSNANSGFTQHLSGNKLALPTSQVIPPSEAVRVWVRRVVAENADNTANDSAVIATQYA